MNRNRGVNRGFEGCITRSRSRRIAEMPRAPGRRIENRAQPVCEINS